MGVRWAVGAPIVVEGRLWGVDRGALTEEARSRPTTEQRLAEFTELVATAVANTQAATS